MGKLPTYKQWKLISEAYGNQITLGVGTPQSLGIMGSHLQLDDEEAIEEAKKKKMIDIKVTDDGEDKEEKKPPFMKKDKDGSKEHEEGETDAEEKEEHKSGEEKKDEPPFFKKKGKKGKKDKEVKEEAEMTPEEKTWWASLKNMTAYDPNKKFSSGLSEELLVPPTDPNQGLVTDEEQPQEPQPGEPGFAPQQRIGGWFM